MTMKTLAERFCEKVSPEPNTGCWLWMGASSRRGYGALRVRGRLERAHRLAWILAGRGNPGTLHVLHRCDNPTCVNPDHLFLGTHAENMADMSHKGRSFAQQHPDRMRRGEAHHLRLHPEHAARGERNGQAKLSRLDVQEIRRRLALGEQHKLIALDFGVSRPTVSMIAAGRIWAQTA